jgi:hypothetical protein
MSNPVKEKISTNLQKAKGEGRLRAENIREIVKDAVSQTTTELKAGTGEIGVMVKDAIASVIANIRENGKETTEKITASIEGAIEGSTFQRQQAIAQQRSKLLKLQEQIDEQQQQLDREISGALIDIKSSDDIDDDSEAINSAVTKVQERQEFGILQEQYLKLKSQLASLDQKLAARYGDRYEEVKQQLENAKTWYSQKKTEAEASGTIPLLQKQTEVENNLGDFGSIVARKEQEVKQHLQEFWQNKGFSTKDDSH